MQLLGGAVVVLGVFLAMGTWGEGRFNPAPPAGGPGLRSKPMPMIIRDARQDEFGARGGDGGRRFEPGRVPQARRAAKILRDAGQHRPDYGQAGHPPAGGGTSVRAGCWAAWSISPTWRSTGSGGTATQEKHAAGFRLLAVDSAARGMGAGRALAQKCVDLAREGRLGQVIIHTTRSMQVAWGMYERWASSAPWTWTSCRANCRCSAFAFRYRGLPARSMSDSRASRAHCPALGSRSIRAAWW